MAAWMQQQATLLDWCARRAALAPRVQPTRQGALVSTHAGWHALALDFISGTRPRETPPAYRRVAARLGELHELGRSLPPNERAQLPESWWAPLERAIARAQGLLAASAAIPPQWQRLADACQQTLDECRSLSGLPETLIHGDCWLGNAVAHTPEQLVLIDWEYAGWGVGLLDLGSLLSDCFGYPEQPSVIDEARIAAVMNGYQEQCPLSAAEHDALRLAIRFGSAFLTAIRCYLGSQLGWGEGIERGLLREQARLAVSEQIAAQARRHIALA